MNKYSLLLNIGIIVICALFLAQISIQFKPFKIELKNWLQAVGYLVLFAGIGILIVDTHSKAYAKGVHDGGEVYEKALIEKINEFKMNHPTKE